MRQFAITAWRQVPPTERALSLVDSSLRPECAQRAGVPQAWRRGQMSDRANQTTVARWTWASRIPIPYCDWPGTQTEGASDVHLDSRCGRDPDVRERARRALSSEATA